MNHKDILKRAWNILWDYKALWLFGFILAITTASGSSSNAANSASNSSQGSQQPPEYWGESFEEGWEEFSQEFDKLFVEVIPAEVMSAVIAISVLVGCVIVILIVIVIIFRYMSETALIKMVDHYEETDQKLGVRDGFRLGFSRTAWKVFLVDLVINLPLIILGIFFAIMVMMPLLLLLTASEAAGILGVVMTIGLFFVGIFLAFIIFAVISLMKHFFRRAVAIEELGVFEAIRFGFQLVRQNLVNIALMWLITVGINIGFSILLIPVAILVLIVSALFSGAIGLAVGGLMGLFTGGPLPIAVGLAAGIPIFILLMVIPLGFIDGLRETFMSSTWTLTYREACALESLDLKFEVDDAVPELDDPSLM
jgi:hypothetical protein